MPGLEKHDTAVSIPNVYPCLLDCSGQMSPDKEGCGLNFQEILNIGLIVRAKCPTFL